MEWNNISKQTLEFAKLKGGDKVDKRNNQKLVQMIARNTVKIRRATNGYVVNTEEGMAIAKDLDEVKAFLDKKFKGTIDTN